MQKKTWGEVATSALSIAGINGTTAPASSEDIKLTLSLAERLIPWFENKGIFLGANITPDFKSSSESHLPDFFFYGFEHKLAMDICNNFGINPPSGLIYVVNDAIRGMMDTKPIKSCQNPLQPTGQGDRRYYRRFKFMDRALEYSRAASGGAYHNADS